MGDPEGTTCVGKRDLAIAAPQKYGSEYHARLVAKLEYCNDCYATDQILWRERRVQELRAAFESLPKWDTRRVGMYEALNILESDEWREQIRKDKTE